MPKQIRIALTAIFFTASLLATSTAPMIDEESMPLENSFNNHRALTINRMIALRTIAEFNKNNGISLSTEALKRGVKSAKNVLNLAPNEANLDPIDLRSAAILHFFLSTREDEVKNLRRSYLCFQKLLEKNNQPPTCADYISMVATCIYLAHTRTQNLLQYLAKAETYLHKSMALMWHMPLDFLEHHLPIVQELKKAAIDKSSQKKPLSELVSKKLIAYEANILLRIQELKNSMQRHHSSSSCASDASTVVAYDKPTDESMVDDEEIEKVYRLIQTIEHKQ